MTRHPPIALPQRAGAVDEAEAELSFLGTVAMLIRIAGFTILVDPSFFDTDEQAPSGHGLRTRRERAMMPEDLPRLDVIVLSHHHGGPVDITARLRDKQVPIVTTPRACRKLRRQGFRETRALPTWESQLVTRGSASVKITSLPGRPGRRSPGWLLPPVMGSLLEFRRTGASPLNLYLTGDTLVHDRLREIARRYPTIHLTLLHLGGRRIAGTLLTVDAQGVEASSVERDDSCRFSLVH